MRSLFSVLLLAACSGAAPPPGDARDVTPEPDAARDDPCGAADYAGLVGANVAAVTLPANLNHRVIYPDTAVTMDFVPERLNVEVTADGTVVRLRCG